MTRTFTICAAALLASGCATLADLPTERVAQARLDFANGSPAGTAQIVSNGANLTMAVVANGLKPGEHGFHLHTTGSCTAPGFTSAGGHLNPSDREHGSLNPNGRHLGDLPNLRVGNSGTASADIDIGPDTPALRASLFDSDGTAVVIHQGADDYQSDPAGNAGPRVACGVLRRLD